MNPRRSLFLKILLWFFMTLVLLIALLAGIFNLDFRLRPDSALITGLGGQGKALGSVILHELYDSNYYEWGSILDRIGSVRPTAWILPFATPTGEFWQAGTAPFPPRSWMRWRALKKV